MSPAAAEADPAKKSAAGAQKKTPGHPPFAEMISDAIVVLKERNGSSQVAIQKFVEEKYKHLPATFRNLLLIQLKRMVASGKLVRVKHSFKLASSSKLAPSTKPKPKAKEPAVTAKPEAKGPAAKEKKSDAVSVKKRKAGEKPATKAKPAAAKAARASKKMTSPGKKVEKPKKTAVMKKVKSPMKKATPKKAKMARKATK